VREATQGGAQKLVLMPTQRSLPQQRDPGAEHEPPSLTHAVRGARLPEAGFEAAGAGDVAAGLAPAACWRCAGSGWAEAGPIAQASVATARITRAVVRTRRMPRG